MRRVQGVVHENWKPLVETKSTEKIGFYSPSCGALETVDPGLLSY